MNSFKELGCMAAGMASEEEVDNLVVDTPAFCAMCVCAHTKQRGKVLNEMDVFASKVQILEDLCKTSRIPQILF